MDTRAELVVLLALAFAAGWWWGGWLLGYASPASQWRRAVSLWRYRLGWCGCRECRAERERRREGRRELVRR